MKLEDIRGKKISEIEKMLDDGILTLALEDITSGSELAATFRDYGSRACACACAAILFHRDSEGKNFTRLLYEAFSLYKDAADSLTAKKIYPKQAELLHHNAQEMLNWIAWDGSSHFYKDQRPKWFPVDTSELTEEDKIGTANILNWLALRTEPEEPTTTMTVIHSEGCLHFKQVMDGMKKCREENKKKKRATCTTKH